MRNYIFTFIVLWLSINIGCSKDKQSVVENEWQVESIKVHTDSTLQYPDSSNVYTLSFENKRNYYIKLNVNSCSGKVNFKWNNKVEFKDAACTLICCNSDFAESIIDILAKVNQYNVTEVALILTGEEGKIINLKKK